MKTKIYFFSHVSLKDTINKPISEIKLTAVTPIKEGMIYDVNIVRDRRIELLTTVWKTVILPLN